MFKVEFKPFLQFFIFDKKRRRYASGGYRLVDYLSPAILLHSVIPQALIYSTYGCSVPRLTRFDEKTVLWDEASQSESWNSLQNLYRPSAVVSHVDRLPPAEADREGLALQPVTFCKKKYTLSTFKLY